MSLEIFETKIEQCFFEHALPVKIKRDQKPSKPAIAIKEWMGLSQIEDAQTTP